jgi:hypothetical protein
MPETMRHVIVAPGWRRTYLAVVIVGWFLLTMFDGFFILDDRQEHWFEAGLWGVALVGYAAGAWRRPLDPERRWADWMIATLFLTQGTTMVLRATLPDAVAFTWAMAMLAAWTTVVMLIVRRARAREQAAS